MQDEHSLQQETPVRRIPRLADLARGLEARPKTMRWILGGPVALIVTLLIMMGMAHWWPRGVAQINNIAMPVVLFPLIWAGVFFYLLAEDKLARATLVMVALALGNLGFLLVSI